MVTFVHVPAVAPEALQDLQVPLHSLAQQTPCRQSFELHSPLSLQTAPFDLRPQDPDMQTAGDAQSELLVQTLLQAAEPHEYGAHERVPGVTHFPLPSHVDVAVKVGVPDGQVAPAQDVPLEYFWQAPAWHLPLFPQLAAP